MCGHVGIAGKLELKDEACLKRLLMFDYFRGPDSTGLAAIRNNGDVSIAKIASNPIDLFDSERFKKALNYMNSKVFLGHNRAATKGVINNFNAHPYQFDHIVGAHNGTLETASWNKLKEITGEEFGVDSQNIIHAIAKLGIEETMKHMAGAWSLVWVDLEKNTLNFLRNDKRPMWWSYSEDFKKLYWASEYPMLQAATKMSTNGDHKLYTTDQGYKFFETAVDVWYRFDLEALSKGGESRPKAKVKELKGEGPVTVAASYSRPFGVGNRTTDTSTTTSSTTTSRSDKSNVVHMFGNKEEPFAGYITAFKAQDLAKNGCSWCWQPFDVSAPGVTYFDNHDKVMCPKCSTSNITTVFVEDLEKVRGAK